MQPRPSNALAAAINRRVFLSPTAAATYEACPRKYHYQKVLRWEEESEGASLVFGSVMHSALEVVIPIIDRGGHIDAAEEFGLRWGLAMRSQAVTFKDLSSQDLLSIGRRLITQAVAWFKAEDLELVYDRQGKPILERQLELTIGNVVVRPKFDLIVRHRPTRRIFVLDWKTPKTASPEGFGMVADQLTAYEVGAIACSDEFGIDPDDIAGSAFVELLKQKTNPRIVCEWPKRPRSEAEIEQWIANIGSIGDAIAQGLFPRRPGMAFGSPCTMCGYKPHCWENKLEGIIVPEEQLAQLQLEAA